METLYSNSRLPDLPKSTYRAQFEKDFFMVVNLLRDNPLSFQTYIKNFVSKGKFSGNPSAANTLIKRLHSLEKLEPIKPNEWASSACFVNLNKNEANPQNISGGAVKELKTTEPVFEAENKCFDTFKRKWVGSALELVLTFLLAYYERQP